MWWLIFFAYLAGAGTAIVAIAALYGKSEPDDLSGNQTDDELDKIARKIA